MADVELVRNGRYDAKACRREDAKKREVIKASHARENTHKAKEVLKERWKVGHNNTYDTLTFGQSAGKVCEHNKWSACRYREIEDCKSCPDYKNHYENKEKEH